jgi:TonB family protein
MRLLVESAVKGSLIVLIGLAIMPLLRNRAAALRHWVLAAALVCAAAAPAVSVAAPAWQLPAGWASTAILRAAPAHVSMPAGSSRPRAQAGREGIPIAVLALTIWLAGIAVSVAVLLVGLWRLRFLAIRAVNIRAGLWTKHATAISRKYRVRQPVLLQTRHPALLVTWGVWQPRILLPAGATGWGDERIRLVLSHELAHARRGDWLITLGAGLLCAVYWFNPIVWIACRRLRQESEQACDDVVLNGGVEGADYAAHLVEIVRELRQERRTWVPALSIARRSTLERRVRAMLDPKVNRRPVTRLAGAATMLALALVTIPVTSVVVAQVFTTLSGSVVDPTNGALAGVTLVLTNTQTEAKYEVRSDRSGRYEFVGLAPGEYALQATLPGFAALKGKLTVGGSTLQRDFKLEVGTLMETVNVRTRANSPPASSATSVGNRRVAPPEAPKCASVTGQDGTPMGGNIRPPLKIFDVRPYYPASAVDAAAQGAVRLEARIGPDGNVEDVRTVSTPHADLTAAAVDAVRQWQFTPTYLNCVAIPVSMSVTVNFELER